jgi:hypothetical protein
MSLSSSSDDSDEDIILQILINLPRPRWFKDRSNPFQDYDDWISKVVLGKNVFKFFMFSFIYPIIRSTILFGILTN